MRAETGDEVWQQPTTVFFDVPYEWRGRILVASSTLLLLDPATGETVKSYRQSLGFDTVPLGDVLVGAGPDVVARLVDP